MAIYNAKKPTYTGWQWAKSILARIFFPPVLVWDLLKLTINKIFGKLIGGLVLPAQDINFSYNQINNPSELNTETLTYEKHDVLTHDGTHLDTLEITHDSQKDVDPKFQKYIINLVGNGMAYEQIIDEMQVDADTLKLNVIGFNLRGVSQSTGRAKSKDDLVIDGIAQVQRLLDKGVSPQNITLKAHSLGAGVASLVAQHFHNLEQPINLFNSRSFSSFTNFLVGQIRLWGGNTSHQETLIGKILGWIAKPFIKLILALANWEINAGAAFQEIPHEYKDHMVVRTRQTNRDENVVDDRVIPHYASIHAYLKDERSAQKAEIDKLIQSKEGVENENSLINNDENNSLTSLKAAREQFKERKMEAPAWVEGHNASMGRLYNRNGKNANIFFNEFIQRSSADHAIQQTATDLDTSTPGLQSD